VRPGAYPSFSIPQRPAPEEEFYRQIELINRQKVKYAVIIVRVLLGFVFAVFGSNAFLHFIPMPPMQGLPGQFIGALFSSGYIYAIAGVQVVGGLLLLIGRFVPLGLALLVPVIVNIMLYHIFLDPSGLGMACVISVLALLLLWAYRDRFAPLLKP